MKLLIDADSIAYRAAAAAEKRVWYVFPNVDFGVDPLTSFQYKKDATQWADDNKIEDPQFKLVKEPEPIVNALHNAKEILNSILDEYAGCEYQLYLSSSENFRDALATIKPYKGNRDNLEKPYHLQAVRDYLLVNYGAEICEGYEADDAVSMAAYSDSSTVIVSIDKDLNNTPGTHYDWVKEEEYEVDEEEAEYHFYFQMLAGDTVDNIAGVPRIGKKTAEKILKESKNFKCTVGLKYAIAYDDPEAAFEENARLLWMARESINDWDWTK